MNITVWTFLEHAPEYKVIVSKMAIVDHNNEVLLLRLGDAI